MKILHTADWHIDANIIEAGRCLKFLVQEASRIEPHLVVISGDMFNSADVRLDSHAARLAMKTVRSLAKYSANGVVILIGTPSHDGLAATIFDEMPKVIVADKPNSIIYDPIVAGEKHLVVSCLPQPTKQYLESALDADGVITSGGDIEDVNQAMSVKLTAICTGFGAARAQYEDAIHICLGHFTVRGAKISPTQQMIGYDIELSTFQLNSAHPTLWCLCHIHHAQEVEPGIFYSGSIYRVDFGERESDKGFYVHNIESAQPETDPENPDKWSHNVKSEFIKTPASTMNKVKLDRSDADPDAPIEIDDSEIEDKMQLEIKCYSDQLEVMDFHIIKEDLIARGAKEVDVIVLRIPRPNIRSAKILAVESLREKLIARAELTDDEVTPGVLEKADLIETMKAEFVLEMMKKRFEKGDKS